jgi:hypothetical protein
MNSKSILIWGENAFTQLALLRKAAEFKGLVYGGGYYTEPIKEYTLDERLLTLLAGAGIEKEERSDTKYEIFTLVDKNPQFPASGFRPGNYWNFKLKDGKYDLKVEIGTGPFIRTEVGGVVFVPYASGTFPSPGDRLPNLRMFKILVDSDPDPPAIAKEMAKKGNLVVTWKDLGLVDIRTISDVFREFAAGRKAVENLTWQNRGLFNPDPEKDGSVYITEAVRPLVVEAWRRQLAAYRRSLA